MKKQELVELDDYLKMRILKELTPSIVKKVK
jgi:hypothetical protein